MLFLIVVSHCLLRIYGIGLLVSFHIFPLLIESDSLNVVNLYNDLIFSKAQVGVVIQEIKFRIAFINIISISHVCRSCNMAHVVARKALSFGCNSFWEALLNLSFS
ncbi:hypothetical protein ACOSP7_005234 [Xanthoceras sorbifolium]